jgi:hypothetical protein
MYSLILPKRAFFTQSLAGRVKCPIASSGTQIPNPLQIPPERTKVVLVSLLANGSQP